jgi:hypothetical protein
VDTGIAVRESDRILVEADGSITLSNNGADVANPGGAGRQAPNAPLPNHPAGALIARIGANGSPIIVGNRQSFTANSTGRLYLGINDDYFDDNRGQYNVSVSIER